MFGGACIEQAIIGLMKLEGVGHIFCAYDYALNNYMFYILTSTALALFELHSLFSD